MNKTSSFHSAITALLVWTALIVTADAQTAGAFRVVNATGLPGRVHFYLNGEIINSEGYESGQTTGNMGIPAKLWELKVKHTQCEEAIHAFEVTPGQQMAIIAYTEPVIDPKTGDIIKRVIKFGKIEGKPRGAKRSAALLFLSVSKQMEITMNNNPVVLEQNKQLDVSFAEARGTGVDIKAKGKDIGGINIEEMGDYAVVVYDNPDGTQGCVTFYNSKRR